MEHLAFITLLVESNNEDDFKSNTIDAFGDTTWNQLSKLLEPSYTIRGFDAKTPIHFEKDTPQEQKVSLTGEAYRKHISELNKCGFE